jgi:hypothetical protein
MLRCASATWRCAPPVALPARQLTRAPLQLAKLHPVRLGPSSALVASNAAQRRLHTSSVPLKRPRRPRIIYSVTRPVEDLPDESYLKSEEQKKMEKLASAMERHAVYRDARDRLADPVAYMQRKVEARAAATKAIAKFEERLKHIEMEPSKERKKIMMEALMADAYETPTDTGAALFARVCACK